jgi:hypothetical protein
MVSSSRQLSAVVLTSSVRRRRDRASQSQLPAHGIYWPSLYAVFIQPEALNGADLTAVRHIAMRDKGHLW